MSKVWLLYREFWYCSIRRTTIPNHSFKLCVSINLWLCQGLNTYCCFCLSCVNTMAWNTIHVSVNKAIIGSGNDLSPDSSKIVIQAKTGLLSLEHQGTSSNQINFHVLKSVLFLLGALLFHWLVLLKCKYSNFHTRILIWKCRFQNGDHFISASTRYWAHNHTAKPTTTLRALKSCKQRFKKNFGNTRQVSNGGGGEQVIAMFE